MSAEPHPVPEWVVVGAGTGGTSATLGRYIRYRGYRSKLCVPDPEGSAFYAAWCSSDPTLTDRGSRIEGIGRPRVEPSFVGQVIDRMTPVPDECSVAAMREAAPLLGRRVGPSTGTNLWTAFELAAEMHANGLPGSIVTLVCDGGERYAHSYYDDIWVEQQGWSLEGPSEVIRTFLAEGTWTP